MKKILVVDDDGVLGEMLQYILGHEGYDVAFLKNPTLAKAHIIKYGTQLVLLDKLMRQVDGSDVCRRLKSDAHTANIPVLMMSGLDESRMKCMEAGADGFLAKPFERDELLKKVKHLLGNA